MAKKNERTFDIFIKDAEKKINKNIHKFHNKKVILFSVSVYSQVAFEILKKHGINILYTVDNDPIQQQREWKGYAVKRPEDIDKNDNIIVIICGGFLNEKYRQLKKIGLTNNKIFVIEYPKDSKVKEIVSVFWGLKLYNRIKKEYGEKEMLLCPYPGTGDLYLTGRYLNYYIDKHNIGNNYLIIVTNNSCRKVLELYGYDKKNILVITEYECKLLRILITYIEDRNIKIHYMLYWGLHYQYSIRINQEVSFNDVFEKTVFGLEKHIPILPKFSTDSNSIKDLIKKNEIIPQKTVILAPYANSYLQEVDNELWEKLVRELKKNGFRVFTNSASDKEPVIKGSRKIFLSYQDMFPIIENSGYFIGMRSGLCDLMSNAKCKKIIIYQDSMLTSKMKFFSLNNMGLCDDAIEFKYDGNNEKLLKSIIDEIKNNR